MRREIRIGECFGLLEVTGERVLQDTNGGSRRNGFYPCKCDCGEALLVRGAVLSRQRSCGCLKGHRKHLQSRTRLYKRWKSLKLRCLYPGAINYHHYGGRGIKLCPDWLEWENFRDWALSSGYAPELWLERRDNQGDYCPANCLWVTTSAQARNRSTNRHVTAWQETKCVADWLLDHRCHTNRAALGYRLAAGWSAEAAISTPTRESQYQSQ